MDIDTAPCHAQIALAIDENCADLVGALENILAIVRRTGLSLLHLTLHRGDDGADHASVVLDVEGLAPAPVSLVMTRFENLCDVATATCTVRARSAPGTDAAEKHACDEPLAA